MLGSANLTAEQSTQLSTVRGMAHFAGTGPEGKTCHNCKFRGYKRVPAGGIWGKDGDPYYLYYGCAIFFKLTSSHGPVVKPSWAISGSINFEGYPPACKYFVDKPQRKSRGLNGSAESHS